MRILVVEPQGPSRERVEKCLHKEGFRTVSADRLEMPKVIRKYEPAAAIIGPVTADLCSLSDLTERSRTYAAGMPLLLLTRNSSEELAIAALRAGMTGYVTYSCPDEEIIDELRRCLRDRRREDAAANPEAGEIIGESPQIREVKAYLSRVALTDCNILITGETGTGKELAAEFIHRSSKRKDLPLVTVNCAAIPDTLLESELFGYEQGAFTGAQSAKSGKLKAADGGTFFLDEVGDLSAYAQAKILRTIDKKEIQRLGCQGAIPLNVRFVAATNQELEKLVGEGTFRKDLFYRLNVACIHLPPLRERKEDIPSLVDHYLHRANASFSTQVSCFSDEALTCMTGYSWPGNVRELKNTVEILCIHASSPEISVRELPGRLSGNANDSSPPVGDERKRLLSALTFTDWNKSKAAERLHWSRMTLYRKMAKYQLSRTSVA